jgi:hypothetical protein
VSLLEKSYELAELNNESVPIIAVCNQLQNEITCKIQNTMP